MARNQPLDLYQGDDWTAVVYVQDPSGNPVDVSDHTAKAQIRRSSADTDSTVDAEMTTSITGFTVTLGLTHTVLAALSGSYRWDLQLTDIASGGVQTVLYGPVTVLAEVTR